MTDETFERVARTYGDMLYRVAYHALKNRADVTQTVLLKLYQQGDRFESEEHRKHWLLRVSVNESRKLLRSFWRRVPSLWMTGASWRHRDMGRRQSCWRL